MKKILYLFIISLLAVSCTTEPKYVIDGTIDGADGGVVLLQQRTADGITILDSAVINKGIFKMEGFIAYPQMVTLTIKDKQGRLSFFLENSRISITGHADSLFRASVTGSSTQSEFETYTASLEEMNAKMEEAYNNYNQAKKEGNKALMDSIEKDYDALDSQQVLINKDFIKNNPKSFVTPLILNEVALSLDATELETLLNGVDTTLNKVNMVKDLRQRVELMKAVAIGQKAPDFTVNDVNGNPVSLYSKIGGKNKLLLVDFWASWCGPCRQENPNVVKIWKEYNKKGFDVFGVSLDFEGDAWKKAIVDDQLTWTHVSDIKGWRCEPARLYAVNSIPANFLLDENGIIIGHNLRGESLGAKVKEILGSK